MASQVVEVLIEGGKATAAPPLGPALGPMGVNIGQVVADINKKTQDYKGMQVPVKVIIDSDTKEYNITIGTPPASALIKQEAKIQKGSGNPKTDKVADLHIENIIKIAKMKEDALLGNSLKQQVKEIIGTCNSMGIMVEGKQASEAIREVNEGKFDKEIAEEKTEISAEELKEMEEERKKLQADVEAKRASYLARANAILKENEGKDKSFVKAKMIEAGIPDSIRKEVMPDEKKAPEKGAKK